MRQHVALQTTIGLVKEDVLSVMEVSEVAPEAQIYHFKELVLARRGSVRILLNKLMDLQPELKLKDESALAELVDLQPLLNGTSLRRRRASPPCAEQAIEQTLQCGLQGSLSRRGYLELLLRLRPKFKAQVFEPFFSLTHCGKLLMI